jgi:hypothetical protein
MENPETIAESKNELANGLVGKIGSYEEAPDATKPKLDDLT